MDWQSVATIGLLLLFAAVLLLVLLKEKRIDSENTIRFASIAVGVLIIVILAFVPVANDKIASGLIAFGGTLFGYVIRDVTKK